MPTLDFYFDVVCPFAFMAFRQLPRVEAELGVEFSLKPVLLGGLLREVGGPDDPNTVMSAPRTVINRRDIVTWAEAWNVPIRIPPAHPRRSVEAMRLCVLAQSSGAEVLEAVARDLFEAYWIAGADIGNLGVLEAIARRHGVDASQLAAPTTKTALREATAAAAAAGAFGVPTFRLPQRIVWGQDRLSILARALGQPAANLDPWPESATPDDDVSEVELFHDFSSPFSYLAQARLETICATRGVPLRRTPILLGAMFRELGTPDVPLFEMNQAKQAYVRGDLDDWAAVWDVPLHFPTRFPIRSVLPLRATIVEPACVGALYRAAWADDRPIDTPEALIPVLEEAGFAAASIVEQCSSPSVKQQLRKNTSAATEAGACGVPTFVIHRRHRPSTLVWGQDRLPMLEAMLDGFQPRAALLDAAALPALG